MGLWKSFSNYLGIFGIGLGAFSGFILRDEFNFPTIKKMEEILLKHQENTLKIEESRQKAIMHKKNLENLKNEEKIQKEKEEAIIEKT